ncbi:unnamed protein product [Durusdinium trenchii]|uniref:Uncharacterized protein n=1 Tax=Durusdinium trenchii TaxID=1381693 RepID=A0ABP0QQM6_9DINO
MPKKQTQQVKLFFFPSLVLLWNYNLVYVPQLTSITLVAVAKRTGPPSTGDAPPERDPMDFSSGPGDYRRRPTRRDLRGGSECPTSGAPEECWCLVEEGKERVTVYQSSCR